MRALLCVFFVCFGCSPLEKVDGFIFTKFGWSFWQRPEAASIKRIHMESGQLLGKEIIVKGKVIEFGEHDTYLVLDDGAGRLLVTLSNIQKSQLVSAKKLDVSLEVWGRVEAGKKGLPVLEAKDVRKFP